MSPTASTKSDEIDVLVLDNDLDRILAVLHNLGVKQGSKWASSLSISQTLLEKYGIRIHWRTIDKILASNRGVAGRRKRSKRWEYYLLTAGKNRLVSVSSKIRMIDPENAVEEVIYLHNLLSSLAGEVRICDPYLSSKTLEQLDSTPYTSTLFLLTLNVRNSGRLRALKGGFKTKGQALEIRVSTTSDLHDRYVIDDSSMYILGSSLNGFSKKQSFIIQAGEDVRAAVLTEFVKRWRKGTPWP